MDYNYIEIERMRNMTKLLHRSEVPEKLTWDLTDLFVSEQAWEQEYTNVEQDIGTVTQYQGKLDTGIADFVACLQAFEKLYERILRVSAYARLLLSGDGSDPVNQERAGKVAGLQATFQARLSFFDAEVMDLADELLHEYLADPTVQVYRKMLLDIRENKPYRLSPETEEVLAALGEVHSAPYMIYQRTKSSDMQFDPITDEKGQNLSLSFALYEDMYESHSNTAIRRQATQSFNQTLNQYKNTFAGTYGTEVKKQVVMSRLRNYPSVTEMLLQPQQVTVEMYHNQLDVIQAELAPHMRRYARLKKQQLGLEQMLYCDLKAPLDPEYDPKITYEESSDLILSGLEILGEEYNEFMAQALHNRWVDLADNIGKSTGAFCSSIYGVHPYILITWTDNMRSAFTLAHELGHCGHFSLAMKYQRSVNMRPSTYLVEAPSTMNELLLGSHILEKSTDQRMKRWVILQYLGTYYHNFVTHLLEGELQRRVYALAESGRSITATVMSNEMGAVLRNFWGDAVEIDAGAELTWMRQPHYYMGLYPYTYSAGLTISTACAQMIKDEGQPAVDRWLEFLKVGGKYKPLEHIKMLGLDMSTPDPLRKAVDFVGTLVDELEKSYE